MRDLERFGRARADGVFRRAAQRTRDSRFERPRLVQNAHLNFRSAVVVALHRLQACHETKNFESGMAERIPNSKFQIPNCAVRSYSSRPDKPAAVTISPATGAAVRPP